MTSHVADSAASYVVATKPLKKCTTVPLGDLCHIKGGGTPSKKIVEYYSGDIPWVTVKDFTVPTIHDAQDHITEKAVTESATNLIPSGTVLVVTRVGLGKVAITGKDMAINQDVKALFPDERILPEYLFWFLVTKADDIERMGAGATVKGITLNQLKGMAVPVPSIEEQRCIVDILKRADGIRRLRKQAQDTARQLIPALFIDMFGDPAINPKGWDVVTFADVGTLDRGKSKHRPRNDPVLFVGSYPFIQTGDVANSDGVIRKFSETYSEVGLQQSRLWPVGTLCITIAANIADTATLGFDACFPDSVVGFIPNNMVTTVYVQYWLSFLKPVLESSAPQLAQKNINLKILRSLPITVPPIELQNEFVARLENIQSITVQQKAAQGSAESSFQSLLHRAFSGGA